MSVEDRIANLLALSRLPRRPETLAWDDGNPEQIIQWKQLAAKISLQGWGVDPKDRTWNYTWHSSGRNPP